MNEAEDEDLTPPTKKPRRDKGEDDSAIASTLSIKEMLSVPNEVVFFKPNEKPLLTRAEGQFFLRISFLAQEIDALVALAQTMLLQRRQCCQIGRKLRELKNPLLRSMIVILNIFESQTTTPALNGTQDGLSFLVMELSSCSSLLRQSAEQNWNVAESLMDVIGSSLADGSSHNLVREKRNLADLEEEVCRRVETLLSMTTMDYEEERRRLQGNRETRRNLFGEESDTISEPTTESLKDVCLRLFPSAFQTRTANTNVAAPVSIRAFTQPNDSNLVISEHIDDAPCERSVERHLDADESQNSFAKRSNAAETLANLALKH